MRVTLKPLAEQTILITGASSGIGLATAKRGAARGARIVLVARNADALARAEQDIRAAGGTAVHVVADVTRREDLERAANEAVAAFGGIDTWVNNAGTGIFGRLAEVSEADHRQLFDVNFWGLVNGSLIAAARLRGRGGALVNLGSIASDVGFPIQGMYAASKHAVLGFTDALRMELEEAGAPISVTLIKPASINTPFPAHAKNYLDKQTKLPPPIYAPEDVADTILHAAEHGGRDYYVGGGGKLISAFNWAAPRAFDWIGSRLIPAQSMRDAPASGDREGTLFATGKAGGKVHGDSPHMVMRSAYTRAAMHPILTGAVVAAAGLVGAALLHRPRS